METKHMHLALHFHIFSIFGWFNQKMLSWILAGNQFIIQNKLQHNVFLKLRIILRYSTDKEIRSGFARFLRVHFYRMCGSASGVGSRAPHPFSLVRYSLDSPTDGWIASPPCLWACQTSRSLRITLILISLGELGWLKHLPLCWGTEIQYLNFLFPPSVFYAFLLQNVFIIHKIVIHTPLFCRHCKAKGPIV